MARGVRNSTNSTPSTSPYKSNRRIRAKNNPNDISLSESQNSSVVVSAMRIKSKTKVDYGRILSRFAKWLLENKPEAMDEVVLPYLLASLFYHEEFLRKCLHHFFYLEFLLKTNC